MSEEIKEPTQPEATLAATNELSEQELEQAAGGIGTMLPAVQKVNDPSLKQATSKGIIAILIG